MARITDYNSLVDEVGRWCNRRDLAERVPVFIQLAESDFDTRLRVREQQKTVEASVTCSSVNLPLDWLEAVRLWLDNQTPLHYVTPDRIMASRSRHAYDLHPETWDRRTNLYTIQDNVIELAAVPTTTLALWMTYYSRVPRLDAANPTNWLLLREPALYLYGALLQAAPYMIDDQRIAVWSGLYEQRMAAMMASSNAARHSGSPLRRVIRGFGPSSRPHA